MISTSAPCRARGYGEFMQIMKDQNGNALVWGNHMIAAASTSITVPDSVIDAAVTLGGAQNHNEQVWVWIRADAGLEIDGVIPRTTLQTPGSVYNSGSTNYLNGGPLDGYYGGCNHLTTDLVSGGFDFACGGSSLYLSSTSGGPQLPVVKSPLQFAGAPAFPTAFADGQTTISGRAFSK
jgi:hypothetical protein